MAWSKDVRGAPEPTRPDGLDIVCRGQSSRGTVVPDNEITIRLQAHRQNIARYRSLLATELTEVERAFIDRRIAEEESEFRRLSALARRQRVAEATGGLVPFGPAANADDCVARG